MQQMDRIEEREIQQQRLWGELSMKQVGAFVGAAFVLIAVVFGLGAAALVTLGGIVCYFVGRFLDGELDLEEIQRRARGEYR